MLVLFVPNLDQKRFKYKCLSFLFYLSSGIGFYWREVTESDFKGQNQLKIVKGDNGKKSDDIHNWLSPSRKEGGNEVCTVFSYNVLSQHYLLTFLDVLSQESWSFHFFGYLVFNVSVCIHARERWVILSST